MKKNKFNFYDFYKAAYSEMLPYFKQEKTQAYTTLVLTLIAVSVFGFFAINPTLSTIANLQKQLTDNQLVDQKLGEKIMNLSILQRKYNQLSNTLPIILAAIPKNPTAPLITGQLYSLTLNSNLTVNGLQISQVDLTKTDEGIDKYSSYNFTLQVVGSHNNVINFISSLVNFDRVITIDAISLNKETGGKENERLNLRGKTYFKK